MTDRIPPRAINPEGVADGSYALTVAGGKVTGLAAAPGGGGAVAVEDEGAEIIAAATRLNFTGAGVTVTDAGSGEATVAIPGGGGGGSSVRSVDDPADPSWGTPTAYDVEFDMDGTSLPAGWSWWNQGTSTWEMKFGAGVLAPQVGGSAPDGGQRGIVRALPAGTTWTARVKIGNGPRGTQWTFTGLLLRDSASGKYTTFARKGGSTATTEQEFITAHNWSATEVYGGSAGDLNVRSNPNVRYLRIDRNSDGTYNLFVSVDGIGWTPVQTNRAAYSAYDQIGLLASAPAGSVVGNEHTFHWFRIR